MRIDSTNTALLNFSLQDIAKKNSVLDSIIRECPMQEKEKSGHLSEKTIKAALRFPYHNVEDGIKSVVTAFTMIENLLNQQDRCYKLAHELHAIEASIEALPEKEQNLYAKEIKEQKEEIADHKTVLNEHLLELNQIKIAMQTWQESLESCLKEQHNAWASFQVEAGKATINILEKHLKTTLKENEKTQLSRLLSLEEVYDRYQELAITPPIPYNDALSNPMNLLVLMGYLTGREVMYRG